jgi:ribosomal protein S18 acetylase RimI-like enzyme
MTMDAVTVRPASDVEYAIAGELCVTAYVAGGHLDPSDGYSDTLRDVAGRADTTQVLVAVREDVVVGSVTICPPESPWAEFARPGEFEFRFLAVDPDKWRQGIGEALVAACEERARQTAASAILIGVIDRNEAGHRMYRRLGFQREPERDWIPVPGVQLLAYRRPVPFGP